MSGALPSGWLEVKFSELNSYRGRSVDPAKSPDTVFELYSVPAFPTGRPEFLAGSKIGSSKQSVQPGDVLVCKINPRINRVWQVKPVTEYPQIASSEWIVVRSLECHPPYLRHYFSSPVFRGLICDGVTGVGGSLTRAQPIRVATFPVPVAPVSEQKRIADKLDALVARVNACSERLDRVPGILKRLRQSILSAATSGELTHDWREERALSKNWRQLQIVDVASVGTGSTPLRSNGAFYSTDGVPWITSAATGLPRVTRAEEFVTPAAIAAHRLKLYPVGTLVIAMYGEGKTRGQVTELGIPAAVNQACAAIVVDETTATKAFVRIVLESNYLEMRQLAEGGNQPNLNLSKIKTFPLLLPPIEEQRAIVERVEAIMSWVTAVQLRADSAIEITQRLTPALLTKAFRGELVPQDPSAEPAKELLPHMVANRITRLQTENTKRQYHRAPRAPKEASAMTKSRQDEDVKGKPYLAGHLRKLGAPSTAEALFKAAELPLADFYKQLAWEVRQGHVKDNRDSLEPDHASG